MPFKKLFGRKPGPKLTSEKETYEILSGVARPEKTYYVLTAFAAVIATFGLLLDSIPVIIGAMLVAPLMTPILAVGLALSRGDTRLIKNVIGSVAGGASVAFIFSVAVAIITPGAFIGRYVDALSEPTLLDLGVAFGAGLAGAYTLAYKHLSPSLPGVAIAAALVPPLGAAGIGAAEGDGRILLGAGVLFLANVVAISFAAFLVFIVLGYYPVRSKKAKKHRAVVSRTAVIALLLVALPMTYFLITDVSTQNRENKTRALIEEYFPASKGFSVAASDWMNTGGRELLVVTLTGPAPPADTRVVAAENSTVEYFDAGTRLEVRFVPYYVFREGKWE